MGVAGANAAQYVLLARSNALPDRIEQNIVNSGGRIVATLPQIGVMIVEGDAQFATQAKRVAGVQDVVEDVQLQFIDDFPSQNMVATEDVGNPPFSGDDDFFFDAQWDMDAIDAPEAWNAGYRGAGVRVAVLDSGVDCTHPDLIPNLNVGLGASFVPGETACVTPGYYFNHGTHVAGIIAAADNGFGIIGTAPEAEIVAVKVLSEVTGGGSFGGIIQGIVYAADIDADVINMSLGVRGGVPHNIQGVASLFVATQRAITYAYQQGTTVVASAGNDARDLDHDKSVISFPGQLAHVITVSATAPIGWATDPGNIFLDNLASYSNYGQSGIHFAAPGGDFIYPGNELCLIAGLVRPCWYWDLVFSDIPGGWSWAAGTSQAAPHVAGVAALIIGKSGGSMPPAQVEAALRQSADDLGKPGQDDAYGHGRLNALRAVQ